MNALSKIWGKYSSMDEYLLKIMGHVSVVLTNTLSKRWGRYSYGRRLPCRERGASIRSWTNRTYSTNGFPEYSSSLLVFVRGVQNDKRRKRPLKKAVMSEHNYVIVHSQTTSICVCFSVQRYSIGWWPYQNDTYGSGFTATNSKYENSKY